MEYSQKKIFIDFFLKSHQLINKFITLISKVKFYFKNV